MLLENTVDLDESAKYRIKRGMVRVRRAGRAISRGFSGARSRISSGASKFRSAGSRGWGKYIDAMRGRGWKTGSMKWNAKLGRHVPISAGKMRARTIGAYAGTAAAAGAAGYGAYKAYKHLKNRKKKRGRRNEEFFSPVERQQVLEAILAELLGE